MYVENKLDWPRPPTSLSQLPTGSCFALDHGYMCLYLIVAFSNNSIRYQVNLHTGELTTLRQCRGYPVKTKATILEWDQQTITEEAKENS